MFAIVDVETTGGHASGHSMTEIAIVIFDGSGVVNSYSTLLNPGQGIPLNIQALTGIRPAMVREAPHFKEVAGEIRDILSDHIFVAHNVNFDYAFVRSAFAACSIEYNPRRMCSVRYARKVKTGLRSYSLQNLCKHFAIENEAAHRALGDAMATTKIFGQLLSMDKEEEWQQLVKKNSGEFNLPANLPSEDYKKLPETAGVYYFKNKSGQPIYIGKAQNLKKRVASHFISEKETKKSQAFKREIYHIEYEQMGSELLASLLEDHEIRHYWPKFNLAQKKPKKKFGVYLFCNQKGIATLAVNKITAQQGFLREFYTLADAQGWVLKMVEKYKLNPARCGFPYSWMAADVSDEDHKLGIDKLLADIVNKKESILIKTRGRNAGEDGFVYIDRGHLAGIGFIPHEAEIKSTNDIAAYLRELRSSITTQGILNKVLEKKSYPVQILS